jgi:hypothetical protein
MSQLEASLLLCFATVVCGVTSLWWYPRGKSDLTSSAPQGQASVFTVIFSILTLFGVVIWWGFPPNFKKLHTWEFFHYYLGTKYFEEVGYSGLYNCAYRSSVESGAMQPEQERVIRDLEKNTLISSVDALRLSDLCRSSFTEQRWGEFSYDVDWFRKEMGERWKTVFHDHGFNPSPWWIWVAKRVLPTGPVSHEQLALLVKWDFALIGILWLALILIVDIRAVCFAAVVWGVNPLADGSWTAGTYLRHDWIAGCVVGIVALSKQRNLLAGMLFGYAACSRVFPAIVIGGVLIHGLSVMKVKMSPGNHHLKILFSALVTTVFVFTVTSLSFGVSSWGHFFDNTSKHLATRGGNLVGVGHVVDHVVQCSNPEYVKDGVCEPPERIDETSHGWIKRIVPLLLTVVFLGWVAWISQRLSLVESVCLSMFVLPLALSPSSYYFEFLIIPTLLSVRFPRVGIGLVLLVGILQLVSVSVSPPNKVYLVASVLIAQFVALLPLLVGKVPNQAKDLIEK